MGAAFVTVPEVGVRAISCAVAIVFLAAVALTLAACIPRPASLGTPSATGWDTPSPANGSGPGAPETPGRPTPVPSFARPTPLPAPTFLAYVVRSGDTLTSIAREFHTTPRSIAFWSRVEHPSLDPESAAYRPDRLEVGWLLLVIPDAVFDEDQLLEVAPSPSLEAAPSPSLEAAPSASGAPSAG